MTLNPDMSAAPRDALRDLEGRIANFAQPFGDRSEPRMIVNIDLLKWMVAGLHKMDALLKDISEEDGLPMKVKWIAAAERLGLEPPLPTGDTP